MKHFGLPTIVLFFIFLPKWGVSQQIPVDNTENLSEKVEKLSQTVDSLQKKLLTKENPFKVSIGASFDFLSGPSDSDLYYDVNFFIPKIWQKDHDTTVWGKIGLDFAFYQTRLFGDSTTINLPQQPKQFGLLVDTVLAESYTLQRFRQTTIENTGIYINPTFKLKENLYGLLFFEGVIQRESVAYDDRFLDIDSTHQILLSEYEPPTSPLRNILLGKKAAQLRSDLRLFFGIGALLNFTQSDVNFRLKPTIGYVSNRPLSDSMTFRNVESFFYSLEVQLVETNTGIKLGGRIRNYINNDEPPTYTIFLSKQFSLSKLGEFITSK